MSSVVSAGAPLRDNARTRNVVIYALTILAILVSALFVSAGPASASSGSGTAAADKQLQQYVYKEMSGNSYSLNGGGSVMGTDLFTNSGDGYFQVNPGTFQELDKKSQDAFVADLARNAESAYNPQNPTKQAETPLVSRDTATKWFKELQDNPGVGSRMLTEMLSNNKPDFIGAQSILSPFQNFLNIGLGVIAMLIMIGLGFVILFDIAFIVIPPFRLFVGEDGGRGGNEQGGNAIVKRVTSVSQDAMAAVKKSEENDGGTAAALGFYLKKRIAGLLLLGLVLLLLVQGQIFNTVGMFMDLVGGLPVLN